MKLIEAHVTNFRSAENSEPFSIEQVTCLVGKNESGKSAVLLALAALNPHPLTMVALDKERDYPRRYLTEYSKRHATEAAIAIKTKWQLEKDDIVAVEAEFGPGVLLETTVEISRRYESKGPEWIVKIDKQKAIDGLLKKGNFDAAQTAALRTASDTTELAEKLATLPATPDPKPLIEKLKGYKSFDRGVREIFKAIPSHLHVLRLI